VPSEQRFRLAVDVGGTFIDFALLNEETGELTIEKQPARAATLVQEFLAGLERLPSGVNQLNRIFHGTTVGINAVLQHSGARVGLITTAGFRDVLALGRGRRPDVYNALYRPPAPLVPRHLRREVVERMGPDGVEITPLDLDAVDAVIDILVDAGVDALAICFLNSYANPEHELIVADRVRSCHPDVAVTPSCEVATEWREFERTSTAILNAYIQPLLRGYLGHLGDGLVSKGYRKPLALMQSNGGVISSEGAARRPIRTLQSGPAGGVIAAQALARRLGYPNVICADVGGTSYDVALIEDGEILETNQTDVGGRPIIGSIIDMVSIGAGGGSIAWIDATGAVQVGPVSAGAYPGPACFGLGGDKPTVTDCHLVLGRLDPLNFLGSRMQLDVEAAERAIELHIADAIGASVVEAAQGILAIAETNMTYALRALTVERGLDPREFVLCSYGGGGGLFAAAVAQELEIKTVVIPRAPANFSAVGILMSDYREDTAATRIRALEQGTISEIVEAMGSLAARGTSDLEAFGFDVASIDVQYRADVRYQGQDETITVPLEPDWVASGSRLLGGLRERFVSMHSQLYGYGSPDDSLEIVTSRCRCVGELPHPPWQEWPNKDRAKPGTTRGVFWDGAGADVDTAIFDREQLGVDQMVDGPAIIDEWTTTSLVPPGWRACVDSLGNLIVRLEEAIR
jgi:N-methylhydantoinase A